MILSKLEMVNWKSMHVPSEFHHFPRVFPWFSHGYHTIDLSLQRCAAGPQGHVLPDRRRGEAPEPTAAGNAGHTRGGGWGVGGASAGDAAKMGKVFICIYLSIYLFIYLSMCIVNNIIILDMGVSMAMGVPPNGCFVRENPI